MRALDRLSIGALLLLAAQPILPLPIAASAVVILAVLIWTAVAAPVFQVSSLTADALWSLLYVGNWRFVTTSNYFAEDGTSSPLLHVWSLAVEESGRPVIMRLSSITRSSSPSCSMPPTPM